MNEGDKNTLLNVLNVLVRISDKQFILNEWRHGINIHTSIVINCREAINIIEDYSLFDLLNGDYSIWNGLLSMMSPNTKLHLIYLVNKLYHFEGFDKTGDELFLDKNWIDIMEIAFQTSSELKADFNIVDNDDFLL